MSSKDMRKCVRELVYMGICICQYVYVCVDGDMYMSVCVNVSKGADYLVLPVMSFTFLI